MTKITYRRQKRKEGKSQTAQCPNSMRTDEAANNNSRKHFCVFGIRRIVNQLLECKDKRLGIQGMLLRTYVGNVGYHQKRGVGQSGGHEIS